MIVVFAVGYLLDVNLVAVVADVLPVADTVADGGCDANELIDWLSPAPDSHVQSATLETTLSPVRTRPCRRRLANATRMYGP